MAERARDHDVVPDLPDLLGGMAECRRRLADAITEVRPFGASFRALSEATDALDALAHHLTGQQGFLGLAEPRDVSHHLPDMLS